MKNWETFKTTYKVSDFISWQRSKTLELSPSFQRRPVWQPGAKSYLLDTIIRTLPIPIIFLREQKTDLKTLEPRREVVDGQQRIRTIFSFIEPNLLKDYKPTRDDFVIQATHNKELAGKSFSDLDNEIQQSILDYTFSVHIFPSQVDDREILEIFARMNSTGVKLNPQELRNAYYFGEFKTSMYHLASEQLERWREWNIFTEYNIARMDEVEITSEFAILILKGLTGKSQAAITRIYKDKDSPNLYPKRNEVENRFRIVMDTIDDKIGSNIRYLAFKKQTIFYNLFLIIYDLLYGVNSPLQPVRPRHISPDNIAKIKLAGERIETKTTPDDVLQAVSRRTTNINSRSVVFAYFRGEV